MKTYLKPYLITLLALFLSFAFSSSAQEAQRYVGSVGKKAAEFQLQWHDDGSVTGSYYHQGSIVYQLTGTNPADGMLQLTEFTHRVATANITLKKSVQQGKITWSGTMHNTDGRKLPVSFSRAAPEMVNQPSTPAPDRGSGTAAHPNLQEHDYVDKKAAMGEAVALENVAIKGERIALVIANGAYESITVLDNPLRDAALVEEALKKTGFRVLRCDNQNKAGMTASLNLFSQLITPQSTALFYYAGHGIQAKNANYLLGVDATYTTTEQTIAQSLAMNDVIKILSEKKALCNIVILDCCRNNGLPSTGQESKKGLAEMKAPAETFICYATGLDEVATDGEGQNSPFSKALATEILKPNLKIDDIFKNVAAEVSKVTNKAQLPWRQSNGVNDFYFIQTKAALSRFRVKNATWSQGDLSFTLENLTTNKNSEAAAQIRIRNNSQKTTWMLALDAVCGTGFQPTVYYGGRIEAADGNSVLCLGARGIYTKVYLRGVWDADRLISDQQGGYETNHTSSWLSAMNRLGPGEETLATLTFRREESDENPLPDLMGKLTVRGAFYGATQSNGRYGKVSKFSPYFQEVLGNPLADEAEKE